jgi:hypothetical protein
MTDEISRDDIARIEAHIEELARSIERCRKLSLAAKIAIATGAAWIVLTLLWIVPFVPYDIVAAMAAVIGGFVVLGSNSTTWTQTETAMRASEDLRADMIGKLELRVVDDGMRRLH